MKDLIIFGASGFGREVAWLVERINRIQPTWNLLGFMDDDDSFHNTEINGYKVLGKKEDVANYQEAYYVCAVGASRTREKIINKLVEINPNIKFGTLIDPSAEISDLVKIGDGTIICAHTMITVNISIGDHVIINLDCTVGHDAVIEDYVTLYPSVNISGMAHIGHGVELGTGSVIIQGLTIGNGAIIGANTTVINNIKSEVTAVGCPAKVIKKHMIM